MSYPMLIFFSLAPSIAWLLFYLRKDVHPESNAMILKIFGLGALVAFPTALIELGILSQLELLPLPPLLYLGVLCVIGVGLPEEVMKYAVVRAKVLSSSEFDEPVDIMLYMIIAALGFAGLENILYLSFLKTPLEFVTASYLRLIGATFLHALCSGLVGYFLALSFFRIKNRLKLTLLGLGLAVVLHGLYNFFIMVPEEIKTVGWLNHIEWVGPIVILTALAIFVSFGFKKVKKLKSICPVI